MKRFTRMALLLLFTLLLTGCAGAHGGNMLLQNASPETSALALYCYDGNITTCKYLYDSAETKKALRSLSAVAAQKTSRFTPAQASAPVYAISIGSKDESGIQAAWSNGYWIAQDGAAYLFDYDFEALGNEYVWSEPDALGSTAALPCARHLCQDTAGWHTGLLTPAEPLSPPEKITASLVSRKNDSFTVAFQNEGENDWDYGEYYAIHVLLDGVWYIVPPIPDDWGFPDIACILPAHTSQEKTYSLARYGSLPDGAYRLVAENLAVEFQLP